MFQYGADQFENDFMDHIKMIHTGLFQFEKQAVIMEIIDKNRAEIRLQAVFIFFYPHGLNIA